MSCVTHVLNAWTCAKSAHLYLHVCYYDTLASIEHVCKCVTVPYSSNTVRQSTCVLIVTHLAKSRIYASMLASYCAIKS